jgi:hypothetical protein
MAIDTAARRHSAFDPGIPWRVGLIPDLTVNAADRRALVQMYAGLAAGNSYSIEAEYGSFEMTGSDATLTPETNIDSDVDRFAAMNIGNPWRGINLVPTGSIGRTQRQILAGYYTPYDTGPTYTLEAETGAFEWDGEPAFSDFEISCEYGDFVMTGNDATLIATRGIVCEAGEFTMTGSDSDMQQLNSPTLITENGLYVMTGSDVTFSRPRTLEASGTAFEMTGYEATLIYTNDQGQEFVGSEPRGNRDAGRPKRRKKHQVEIDGQVYEADSEAEALFMLEKVKERAEEAAKLALERANKALKKPTRKILQDARKALKPPVVESEELPSEAEQILKEIDDLYKDTLMKVEIAALLRKQEEDEEEAILLMLV